MEKTNIIIKILWKYAKILFLLIIIFSSFSILSSLLPDQLVRRNIEKSVKTEGELPNYFSPIVHGEENQLDYAMDGLITNMIYTIDNDKPVRSAFMGNAYVKYAYQWQTLNYLMEHKDIEPNFHYARYWQGNSFLFRFLYVFTEYDIIKWIIYIVTSFLLIILAIQLSRKAGTINTISIFAGLFFVNVYIMQFSMQLSPILMITTISSIVLLKKSNGSTNYFYTFFFVVGGVTCYLDLLTTPLLTLGIPVLIWYSIRPKSENLKNEVFYALKQILFFGIFWLTGYTLIWVSKIIISIPFVEFNLVQDFIGKLSERSGAENFSRYKAIEKNINRLQLTFLNILFAIPLILSIISFNRRGIGRAAVYLAIATTPYIWYFFTANHVYIHHWFTFRAQAISIGGILLALVSLVDWERLKLMFRRKVPA